MFYLQQKKKRLHSVYEKSSSTNLHAVSSLWDTLSFYYVCLFLMFLLEMQLKPGDVNAPHGVCPSSVQKVLLAVHLVHLQPLVP